MSATVTHLEVPVMAVPEAARHGIPTSTLEHWLDGHAIGETFYPPVLRAEPETSPYVTWGEMVEADYLRSYRAKGVSLQWLRPFIQTCREGSGCATRWPTSSRSPTGIELLLELQREAALTDQPAAARRPHR